MSLSGSGSDSDDDIIDLTAGFARPPPSPVPTVKVSVPAASAKAGLSNTETAIGAAAVAAVAPALGRVHERDGRRTDEKALSGGAAALTGPASGHGSSSGLEQDDTSQSAQSAVANPAFNPSRSPQVGRGGAAGKWNPFADELATTPKATTARPAAAAAVAVPATVAADEASFEAPVGSLPMIAAGSTAPVPEDLPPTHVAAYNYQARETDEVALSKGDFVYVLEMGSDGWFVGQNLTTGQVGTFPGNFVKPTQAEPLPSLSREDLSSDENLARRLQEEEDGRAVHDVDEMLARKLQAEEDRQLAMQEGRVFSITLCTCRC